MSVFNIRKFSKKIQRRYAHLKRLAEPQGVASLVEKYREALKIANDWKEAKANTPDEVDGLECSEHFSARIRALRNSAVLRAAKRGLTRAQHDEQTILDDVAKNKAQVFRNRAHATKPYNIAAPGWVGIELELYLKRTTKNPNPRHDLAFKVKKADLLGVTVDNDHSLRAPSGYDTAEVQVLTNTRTFHQLDRLLELMKREGFAPKVNARCGLHVHVNAFPLLQRLDPEARSWSDRGRHKVDAHMLELGPRVMPLLQSCLHPLRRDGYFAKAETGGYTTGGGEKYFAINLQSLSTKGTVEFRCHSGTVDGNKIKHWARMCEAVMFSKFSGTLSKPADLLKLDIPRATRFYLAERIAHFAQPLEKIENKRNRIRYEADSYGDARKVETIIKQLASVKTYGGLLTVLGGVHSTTVDTSRIAEATGASVTVAEVLHDHVVKTVKRIAGRTPYPTRAAFWKAYFSDRLEKCQELADAATVEREIQLVAMANSSSDWRFLSSTQAGHELLDLAAQTKARILAGAVKDMLTEARGPRLAV